MLVRDALEYPRIVPVGEEVITRDWMLEMEILVMVQLLVKTGCKVQLGMAG